MTTAPYPNLAMSFCGALSLQAFLAGRKVRDPGDNRTNLYLLGLAFSAAGKDWPRKINSKICHQIGLANQLGDRFASGEGIQDALHQSPSMLFQTDEIDGMLQSINRAKDARHESIISTLLTMYSAANSVFPARRKAGKEIRPAIDQPCLSLFGTAIPTNYYSAMSERLLTNGFFARMLVIESGPRSKGQEPGLLDIPRRILDQAVAWANLDAGQESTLRPIVVEYGPLAQKRIIDAREDADAQYSSAEADSDAVSTTCWGRLSEHIRKLALVYACSACCERPIIDVAAVNWATEVANHQVKRMLWMAERYSTDSEFHKVCLRLCDKLRQAPDQCLSHSILLRRMRLNSRVFGEVIDTLHESGQVERIFCPTPGRTSKFYKLIGG